MGYVKDAFNCGEKLHDGEAQRDCTHLYLNSISGNNITFMHVHSTNHRVHFLSTFQWQCPIGARSSPRKQPPSNRPLEESYKPAAIRVNQINVPRARELLNDRLCLPPSIKSAVEVTE